MIENFCIDWVIPLFGEVGHLISHALPLVVGLVATVSGGFVEDIGNADVEVVYS